MNYALLRLKKLTRILAQKDIDALMVSSSPNVSYLTASQSRDAYLLIAKSNYFYLTDARYTQEAKNTLGRAFQVREINGPLIEGTAKLCSRLKLNRLGFEERHISLCAYKRLKNGIPAALKLLPTQNVIEGLRLYKDEGELIKIERAAEITMATLKYAKSFIRPGRTELEVAGELQRFMRFHGGHNAAFDIIVASGPNSSSPHHLTSARELKNGEPVLIDIGVEYCGYKSDLTRVFFLGKITSLVKRAYNIISEAQNRAIKSILPKAKASAVDAAARQYISQQGYGRLFTHNLGHGVGLEVHEAPSISAKTDQKLQPGMVFTIEPAIYLPRRFGIRLEDMVVITKKGAKVISGALNK